jgi:hypothetical protein
VGRESSDRRLRSQATVTGSAFQRFATPSTLSDGRAVGENSAVESVALNRPAGVELT